MKNITLLDAILRQTMKAESAYATAMELCETHSEDPDAEVGLPAIARIVVKAEAEEVFRPAATTPEIQGDSEIPKASCYSKRT